MSYEVYVDVRHHPRHLDDWEQRLSDCARLAEPEGATPSDVDRMRAVVGVLRGMADDYDPDVQCRKCGVSRGEHYGYPARLVRCYGQYGEITRFTDWMQDA